MYYSNGKIQSSVAYGDKEPVSALDKSCRDHDTRYALASSTTDLTKADDLFYKEQFGHGLRPSLYSLLVVYVNRLTRSFKTGSSQSDYWFGEPPNLRKTTYEPDSTVKQTSGGKKLDTDIGDNFNRKKTETSTIEDSPSSAPESKTEEKAAHKEETTSSSTTEYCPTEDGATISKVESKVDPTPTQEAVTTKVATVDSKTGELSESTEQKPVNKVIDSFVKEPELISYQNPDFRRYLSRHYKHLRAIKHRKRVYIVD